MSTKQILVVDDENHVAELIRIYLEREGFAVLTAGDGRRALELQHEHDPDLVILDIMLPKMDGWEVSRQIRKTSNVPIIMLTAKDTDLDKITGLELGADDYVTKPFSPGVLVARVRAILRRLEQLAPEPIERLSLQELSIDYNQREVKVKGQSVTLTPKEFDLLWFLAAHPGQVFTREVLLDKVWNYDFLGDTRTVDAHVKRLRHKLEGGQGSYIHTVWGVGYKFEEKVDASS